MFRSRIIQALQPHTGRITHLDELGAGSFASTFRVEAEGGSFFLKSAQGEVRASLAAEALGLATLSERAEGTGLCVPRPIHLQEAGLLLLPWIERAQADGSYWQRLGEGLAALHKKEAEGYGFERDNFIGATPQANGWVDDWVVFFRERRLAPQMVLARAAGRWKRSWDRPAERLLAGLDGWLPRRPPAALVHGDLWGGNHLPGRDGCPWLIDPAVYVGDREVDLAMASLFGGFDRVFFAAYDSAWPREPGHAERAEIYNLYHLLNHLNLFGPGYAAEVERILRRFGGA